MKSRLLAIAICLATTAAWACNIPVFRYALERWQPDACEVIVLHDEALSDAHAKMLEELEAAARSSQRSANIVVQRSRIGQDKNVRNRELWLTLKDSPDVKLPYVVVRTSVNDKQAVHGWHGKLDQFKPAQLLDSPARRELTQRLLKGDSVVWIVLKSRNQQRNAQVKQLLDRELKQLGRTMQFPEGLGLPGSELYAELPLLMQFTVLEIDPQDEAEQFLIGLFRGFHPDAVAADEPLIVPVFGRGRALEVLPADSLDAGTIGDLTRYLCGACSCQVKERNPGFDLLLQAPWERELFGEAGQLPPPPKEFDPNQAPQLVPIPQGKKK
ncbi:MAG: hypothetical protein IT423_12820 [Pirellulaceae bacterium]|nr:hypothetical protein [Pirellulaceae bacterium]